MAKKPFVAIWSGEVPDAVEPAKPSTTPVGVKEEAAPAATPVAAPKAAPADAPTATPAPAPAANAITNDQLMAFTAVLLLKRLREAREAEEGKE